MASARKPESFVWIVNEVELLLRLTLNYKESKMQETHVVHHCCNETSQGSEVEGKRSRGGAMVSVMWKVCRFAVHTEFSTLRPGLKRVRFQALRLQDPCGRLTKTM